MNYFIKSSFELLDKVKHRIGDVLVRTAQFVIINCFIDRSLVKIHTIDQFSFPHQIRYTLINSSIKPISVFSQLSTFSFRLHFCLLQSIEFLLIQIYFLLFYFILFFIHFNFAFLNKLKLGMLKILSQGNYKDSIFD